jgi:putative ATPase
MAAGDLRTAYNALELAALPTSPNADGQIVVTLADAEQSIQRKSLSYNEDYYYNFLSAFCKSLRGSDANAALYYAMRLIEGGCDPMLIARRLVVHSAEDVGMADPRALQIATSAMYALERIGYPEARIPLAEAIIYVCEAEKSNSVVEAMYAAIADARETRDDNIPPYLKDSSYGGAEDKENSAKYKYPHNYENGYVEQQYLPDSLKDKVYYTPVGRGYEKEVIEIRKRKGKKK